MKLEAAWAGLDQFGWPIFRGLSHPPGRGWVRQAEFQKSGKLTFHAVHVLIDTGALQTVLLFPGERHSWPRGRWVRVAVQDNFTRFVRAMMAERRLVGDTG